MNVPRGTEEGQVNDTKLREVFAVHSVRDEYGDRVVVSREACATELDCDCPPCRAQLVGAPTTRRPPAQRRPRRQMIAEVKIDPFNPRSIVLGEATAARS